MYLCSLRNILTSFLLNPIVLLMIKFITVKGLKRNEYSDVVQNIITGDDLFNNN